MLFGTCGATIGGHSSVAGPKTRISSPGGGSARCSVSSHSDRPSASLPLMPTFTTPSTFSVISSPAAIRTIHKGHGEK
jgi:hypothetical protein